MTACAVVSAPAPATRRTALAGRDVSVEASTARMPSPTVRSASHWVAPACPFPAPVTSSAPAPSSMSVTVAVPVNSGTSVSRTIAAFLRTRSGVTS